ncbi:50S ribosomal protein L23 [Thermomicrobiaceae bacterium CFH 74404]|uniref:Large ribosomal subunit protein uL23 n=1 Tax=Thermalbibacter longus TaxID=2951981 RepID=A0AA41WEG9_9BACT|nr:50S ribosomal protein L23 [Thermalbibacter longus]MCM8750577.1 50S ribosomal protein L23 [Thermalbibacter longus]
MDYQDILRRPLITEKNTRIMEMNQYTFEVAPDANKIQIKEAVERTFNVKVKKVNTMNVRGKPRRRIRRRGRLPVMGREASWKKAIVTLEPGYTIDLFSQL